MKKPVDIATIVVPRRKRGRPSTRHTITAAVKAFHRNPAMWKAAWDVRRIMTWFAWRGSKYGRLREAIEIAAERRGVDANELAEYVRKVKDRP